MRAARGDAAAGHRYAGGRLVGGGDDHQSGLGSGEVVDIDAVFVDRDSVEAPAGRGDRPGVEGVIGTVSGVLDRHLAQSPRREHLNGEVQSLREPAAGQHLRGGGVCGAHAAKVVGQGARRVGLPAGFG